MKSINLNQSSGTVSSRSGNGLVLVFPKEFQKNWFQSLDHRYLSIFFACLIFMYSFILYKNSQPAPVAGFFDQDKFVKHIAGKILRITEEQLEIFEQIEEKAATSGSTSNGSESSELDSKMLREIRKNQALQNALKKKASIENVALNKGVLGVLTSLESKGLSKYHGVNFNNGNKKVNIGNLIASMNGIVTATEDGEKTAIGPGGPVLGSRKGIEHFIATLPGQYAVSIKKTVGGAIVGAAAARVESSNSGTGRSGADVQKTINAGMGAITLCFEKQLKKNPTLEGKLTVQILITKKGKVRSVKVVANQLGDKKVASCIASRIKSWKFAKAVGKGKGLTTVNQTFVFGR